MALPRQFSQLPEKLDCFYGCGEALGAYRLNNIRVRPCIITSRPILIGSGCGEHNNGQKTKLLIRADALQNSESVHFWHVDVKKNPSRARGRAGITVFAAMLKIIKALFTVVHHLKRLLPEERNKILLVGYQAIGTRGWRLQQGEKQLKMHGSFVPCRAEVQTVRGFSAHGDQADLIDWLSTTARPPERTFLVHGEAESLAAMEEAVRDRLGWPTEIPEYMSSVELA